MMESCSCSLQGLQQDEFVSTVLEALNECSSSIEYLLAATSENGRNKEELFRGEVVSASS